MLYTYIKYSIKMKLVNFILNKFDISIPNNAENIVKLTFLLIILYLMILRSFIKIISYFLGYYILQETPILKRYSFLNRIASKYTKGSLFFIILEILMCLFFLIIIILLFMLMLNFLL